MSVVQAVDSRIYTSALGLSLGIFRQLSCGPCHVGLSDMHPRNLAPLCGRVREGAVVHQDRATIL